MLMAPPLSRSGSMQRGGPDDVTLRLGLTEGSHINVCHKLRAMARRLRSKRRDMDPTASWPS